MVPTHLKHACSSSDYDDLVSSQGEVAVRVVLQEHWRGGKLLGATQRTAPAHSPFTAMLMASSRLPSGALHTSASVGMDDVIDRDGTQCLR